jgi:hypothetical protein
MTPTATGAVANRVFLVSESQQPIQAAEKELDEKTQE